MAKFANALQKLHLLIEPKNKLTLHDERIRIEASPNIQRHGIQFSVESFREFIMAFRAGMMYAAGKYPDSIPNDINWFEYLQTSEGLRESVLRYQGRSNKNTDEIVMTHFYIASYCVAIERGMMGTNDHLPAGFVTGAASVVMLNAIEECFHCHQIRALRTRGEFQQIDTLSDRDHPIEQEIFAVIETAIKELSIPEYLPN